MRTYLASASLLALSFACANSAQAQEAENSQPAGAEADSGSEARTLGTVTVTAQRREQSLQDVPVTVSAFSGANLESSGVQDLGSLSTVTTGLRLTQSRGLLNPYLRGVGAPSGAANATPSVAVYVDGVYDSSLMGGAEGFANIDRVEVLKGPQGTLFGQSATGGLIHIITKDPTHDPSGSARLAYGNFNYAQGSLYYSQGLTEDVAADISVFVNNQGEGFGTNLPTGEDVFRRREWQARSKVLWTPGDDTRIIGSLSYAESKSDFGQARDIEPGTFGLPGGTPSAGGIYDTQNNLDANPLRTTAKASLRVEHDFGLFDFTSISAFARAENTTNFDQEATPVPFVDARFDPETADSFQQEFMLTGSTDRLDWTAGVAYFSNLATFDPVQIIPPPLQGSGSRIDRYVEEKMTSYAAFAQGTYSLTDRTRLTLGARITSDERNIVGRDDVVVATGVGAPVQAVAVAGTPARQTASWDEPTWRLALDHDLTDDLLIFGSVSRGYKTGQFNMISYTGPSVNPEILDAYEVGVKYNSPSRTFRANASGFFYEFEDIQLIRVTTGGNETVNAASAEISGLDVDFTWLPLDNLELSASATLLDATYTDYPNADAWTSNPPAIGGNTAIIGYDASGNNLVNAPDLTFSLRGDYSIPLEHGSADFNLTYAYTGDVAYSVDQVLTQDAYDLVNAKAGYTSDDGWGIALYVKNLTESEYYSYGFRGAFGNVVGFGDPRTYGIELTYKWGQ